LEVSRKRAIGGGYLVKVKKELSHFSFHSQELSKLSFFASFDNFAFVGYLISWLCNFPDLFYQLQCNFPEFIALLSCNYPDLFISLSN